MDERGGGVREKERGKNENKRLIKGSHPIKRLEMPETGHLKGSTSAADETAVPRRGQGRDARDSRSSSPKGWRRECQ